MDPGGWGQCWSVLSAAGGYVPTVLSLLTRQLRGPSWIMRRDVRSRFCGGKSPCSALPRGGRVRAKPVPSCPHSGRYLELGCQRVAGAFQRGGIQALLVGLQPMPVLCPLHRLVHVSQDLPALVPGTAQLLMLWGPAWR